VALLGDSNAAMWTPGFEQIAKQRHWRLDIIAKADCPFLDVPIINPAIGREYTQCEQWRGEIVDRLQAQHTNLAILSMTRLYGADHGWNAGFAAYDRAWLDGITRMVEKLRSIGTKVLVLGPIPDPLKVIPDCLSRNLENVQACSPPSSKALNPTGIAAESAATKVGGGQYADLTELFCTSVSCPVIVGNTLVYVDLHHVTGQYSELLAPALGALADRALALN
jgi:hypothetical protein